MASGRLLYDLEPIQPFIDQGYILITPNLRLARRIKTQWDQRAAVQGITAWRRLDVHALDQWLARQWQARQRDGSLPPKLAMDAFTERLRWQSIIESDASKGQFSLLRPQAAAQLAAQARDTLLRWQVGEEALASLAHHAGEDCQHFLRWLGRFEAELAEGGWVTAADKEAELLATVSTGQGPKLLLLDFDDIAPLARACLDHLASEVLELQGGTSFASHEARAYADKGEELAALARWVRVNRDADPDTTIGIVLVDLQGDRDSLEYLLRREFDCLGERYASLPVNFSTGITLDRAPVVRDALTMLATVQGSLDLNRILALLRTRFSRMEDGQGTRAVQLLEELYDSGQREIDVAQLRFLANRETEAGNKLALGEILRQVSGLRLQRLRRPPSAWLEAITEALSLWGWPGAGPLDSLEFQQVERWYDSLERFAGLDVVAGNIDYAAMLQLLTQVCQERISQPQTSDSAIQVLGPLEAAGLQFDLLWLCGMQASRWPPPARPNPFLPQQLQQGRDMPHATPEREWRFTEFLTDQYLRSSGRVIASYCREAEGVPELASALISNWPVAAGEASEERVSPAWRELRAEFAVERYVDECAPAVSAGELEDLRGGSSTLEDQSNCPFRAFARRRLGIESLGDYRLALEASDRGNLLHNALYTLWDRLEDSKGLAALSLSQRESVVGASVAAALDAAPAWLREQAGPAVLELESRRLRSLLLAWLELESKREPFVVTHREAPLEMSLGGLTLRLRIDRIDRLEDGSELLIDYKSSSPGIGQWLSERPASPQLPLYALARPETRGLAFAELNQKRQRFVGIGHEGVPGLKADVEKAVKRYSPASDWPMLRAEWQRNLEALAEAFIAGDARVDPLGNACTYCGLQPLCRVSLEVSA